MANRKPYAGSARGLVVAFDIGTTYSGVSYSLLDPGIVPEIKGVTRFPAQEAVGGDSKIPTELYYDAGGNVRAVGAEAIRDGVEELATEEVWEKAEWFKLHLRPKSDRIAGDTMDDNIPPLPSGKTITVILSDLLRYLFDCTKKYILETHSNGPEIWYAVEATIDFVLTHPNGWEGAQQSQMRDAAVQAGLIPDTQEGSDRLHFVTEGEASLHFCLDQGLGSADAEGDGGKGIMIVDAGGGTIDISSYKRIVTDGGRELFEEIAAPQCFFQGSVYVTTRARKHIKQILVDSKYLEDVPGMIKHFDKTTKRTFRNDTEPAYLKFGTVRDRDPKVGIRNGQLKLPGPDVASFFEPSIACIANAAREQNEKTPISAIYLVGGFGASDWMFTRLKQIFEPMNLRFCRPDTHINKAVADGAVSFYLDHVVKARVSRHAYGIEISKAFDKSNEDHQRRKDGGMFTSSPSGHILLPKFFSVILASDTRVEETAEYRKAYFRESDRNEDLNVVSIDLVRYKGPSRSPTWMDEEPDQYATLCTISANTGHLKRTFREDPAREKTNGKDKGPEPENEKGQEKEKDAKKGTIYKIDFGIVLSFGLTELKAQLIWMDDGIEHRSQASIVYNED